MNVQSHEGGGALLEYGMLLQIVKPYSPFRCQLNYGAHWLWRDVATYQILKQLIKYQNKVETFHTNFCFYSL